MEIVAKDNFPKTIDGEPVGPFSKGKKYTVDDELGQKMIDSAMAEKYVPPPPEPNPESEAQKSTASQKKQTSPARKKIDPKNK